MKRHQLRLLPNEGFAAQKKAKSIAKNSNGTLATKTEATNNYVSSIWGFPEFTERMIYRWYGTLPRPLVEKLISLYSQKGSTILDPFMGTGTTLEIAAETDRSAIGMDTNPLSCLISELRLDHNLSKPLVMTEAKRIAQQVGFFSGEEKNNDNLLLDSSFQTERYEYTRKWFRKDSLNAVLAILLKIGEISDVHVQRAHFVAMAQTIREVASVDPRCTNHLVTKRKEFIDPVPIWLKHVENVTKAIHKTHIDPSKILILQNSALEYNSQGAKAELVIVHPPYIGMINYHLIHRLATDLLDIVKKVMSPESLAKYNFDYEQIRKMDVSTDNSNKYELFIADLASKASDFVESGHHVAVIIGDQRNRGLIRHPFTDFIRFFEANEFALEENFIWVLQNNAGLHILRRGHFIDHNYILIFKKNKR